MSPVAEKWAWPLGWLALVSSLFGIYWVTLAPGLAWMHHGADGGDLITAAVVGGVAHPTGYPTYLLLARLFLALPIGSLAYRANLFSAVCAALAAGVAAVLVRQSCQGRPAVTAGVGLMAGAAFGLSPLLWSQAVITEVYALHVLLCALIVADMLGSASGLEVAYVDWRGLGGGIVFGLGLGNHLSTALLLPPWLVAAGWRAGRFHIRPLGWRLLGLVLGSLVYLYVPLQARALPPVNWGMAVNGEGFWWLISAQSYQGLVFGLPPVHILSRIQAWARLAWEQFGWLGLGLALYGVFLGRARHRRVKWITLWMVIAFSLFAINYQTADSFIYLLPAFLAAAIWLGLGAATGAAQIPMARRGWRALGAAGLGLALLVNGVVNWPGVDASRHTQAETFGQVVMQQSPPRALIFTQGDRDTFTLWYFHFALGERRDVRVIVEPLLDFAWYRNNVRSVYPDVLMPATAATSWRQTLETANPRRPVCETRPDEALAPLICNAREF